MFNNVLMIVLLLYIFWNGNLLLVNLGIKGRIKT